MKDVVWFMKYLWRELKEAVNELIKSKERPKMWINVFMWIFIINLLFYVVTLDNNYKWTSVVSLIMTGVMWIWKLWVQGDWKHFMRATEKNEVTNVK